MKSITFALAGVLLAAMAGTTIAAELPDLKGRTIQAVTENAYTPLNFADPKTGQGIGWEYDAVNEIGKRLNAKIVWNTMAWDPMIQAVHDGQYDIGMDGISITDDRKKQVDFSDPYMDNKEYMLVRKDEKRITQPGDLVTNTDLLIGAQSGTSGFYASEDLLNPNLKDGDKPDVPGWDLTAIWTPGHSPGHLCFYVPSLELMLTGDHVLPRITPNVSAHPQSGDNPLGDFLASLDKVAAYDPSGTLLALPAHEHRFVGLSARTTELRAHHQQRFSEITTALSDGIDTAWEIASRMSWSRSWSGLDHFMRRAALGEAMAHLLAMRADGLVRDVDGVPVRWELIRS